jgi:hypothetical protein
MVLSNGGYTQQPQRLLSESPRVLDASPVLQWQWLRLVVLPAIAAMPLTQQHPITLLGVPPESCPLQAWIDTIKNSGNTKTSIAATILAADPKQNSNIVGLCLNRLLAQHAGRHVTTWPVVLKQQQALPAESFAKLCQRWHSLEMAPFSNEKGGDIIIESARPDALLHLLVLHQHFDQKKLRYRIWLALPTTTTSGSSNTESFLNVQYLVEELRRVSREQLGTDNIHPLCMLVSLARNDMMWAQALWKTLRPNSIPRLPQPPRFRPIRPFSPPPLGDNNNPLTTLFESLVGGPRILIVPGEKKLDTRKTMEWLEAAWLYHVPPHTFHDRLEWFMAAASQKKTIHSRPIVLPQSWPTQLSRAFFEGLRGLILPTIDPAPSIKSLDYFCYTIYTKEATGYEQRFETDPRTVAKLLLEPPLHQRFSLHFGYGEKSGIILVHPLPLETTAAFDDTMDSHSSSTSPATSSSPW